jgi:hypothetical protein
MPSEVEHATHVLNNLRQKRDALVARGVELADERASIALAAHTGDSKASKRLLEVNAALAVRASEVESIDAAIKAAGEKCAAAEQAEVRKDDRRRPKQFVVPGHWNEDAPPEGQND